MRWPIKALSELGCVETFFQLLREKERQMTLKEAIAAYEWM